MRSTDIIKKIEELKLIPVAVIESSENLYNLGKSLLDVGLAIVEVTFKT